jgi:hypothetical protein
MWLVQTEIGEKLEFINQIYAKPSWYKFMDEWNQRTYDFIDEVISQYKDKGYDTLSFIYKLRSNEELRTHFWNTNNISYEELTLLFNETFLPIQKKVEKATQDTKKTANKIIEFRNKQTAISKIKLFLSWRTTIEDRLLSRCEYICIKHYKITIEQFADTLITFDYDQQKKGLLKHSLTMSHPENIWKNLSKNYPELDRKLWSINMDK